MKIAIFSDNFYPELSGISDSIITTAKELAKMGHQIKFVAPRYSSANYNKVGLEEREIDLGPNISILRLPSMGAAAGTGQGRLAFPVNFIDQLKAWQPDILHTNLIAGVGIAALLAKRKLKLPLVGTSHTPFREFVAYNFVAKLFTEAIIKYVSWYYNHCDFVTAPSDFVFKEMIEYSFNKPHRALSNPVDVDMFTPAAPEQKSQLKEKFGFNGQTVLVVGRIAVEKRVDIVIKAFAQTLKTILDAKLVIVGSGTYEKELKRLAKQLGISGYVKFMGYVDSNHLPDIYKASDVYAISSTSETQSISMMNAMASGIPVVAVNAGGLPEYAKPEVGFVVEPGDVDAFAGKLIYLLQNKDRSDTLGRSGRVWAERFSIPNIAKEWEDLFKYLIKKP